MEKRTYPLRHATPGTETVVTAFCFGPQQAQRKIYIQASLHADELPGSLVAHHLFERLERLEDEGRLQSRIVLVPMCNPLGLRQNLFYGHIGRFDFATGQNYNRLRSIRLHDWALERLQQQGFVPSGDAAANVTQIRAAMQQGIEAFEPQTSVEALHAVLVGLAFDSDLVLDLHCDNHAVLHLYTLPQLWQAFEPMARHLGSECQILAEDSQSDSFDESLSTPWLKLQRAWPDAAIPLACHSATVELRGERDLSHAWAQQDADALLQYLHQLGDVQLPSDAVREAPELARPPHPLQGMQYVNAPMPGIVVYHVQAGDWVQRGQPLADVVDPVSQEQITVHSPIDGVVFATSGQRFVHPENKLMSISGAEDIGNASLSP